MDGENAFGIQSINEDTLMALITVWFTNMHSPYGRPAATTTVRPDYYPNYQSAFVIDPEGNNIEAVCHLPE